MKEIVPEEKKGIEYKEFPMENGSHYSPADNQKVGFNQCRHAIITKIEEGMR